MHRTILITLTLIAAAVLAAPAGSATGTVNEGRAVGLAAPGTTLADTGDVALTGGGAVSVADAQQGAGVPLASVAVTGARASVEAFPRETHATADVAEVNVRFGVMTIDVTGAEAVAIERCKGRALSATVSEIALNRVPIVTGPVPENTTFTAGGVTVSLNERRAVTTAGGLATWEVTAVRLTTTNGDEVVIASANAGLVCPPPLPGPCTGATTLHHVAEISIGDSPNGPPWNQAYTEIRLGPTLVAPAATGETLFGSGASSSVVFQYTADQGHAALALGTWLDYFGPIGPVNFIGYEAVATQGAGTAAISNVVYNNDPMPGVSATSGGGPVPVEDGLCIPAPTGGDGYALFSDVLFTWTGTPGPTDLLVRYYAYA